MSERPDSLRIFFFPCGPGLEALNIGSAGSVLQFVDFRPKDTKRFDTLTLRGEKENVANLMLKQITESLELEAGTFIR
jgi:hypothetical protein